MPAYSWDVFHGSDYVISTSGNKEGNNGLGLHGRYHPCLYFQDLKQLEEGVRNSMSIFLVSKIEDALGHIFKSSNFGDDLVCIICIVKNFFVYNLHATCQKTSLGTDIIDSLASRQPGVGVSRSANPISGMDSCHPRLVSML